MSDEFGPYFNADEVETEDEGFDALPPGTYPAIVEELQEKTAKSGNAYVGLCLAITGPKYKNRKVFENFNIFHEKDQVRAIAKRQFAGFCKALNACLIQNEADLRKLVGKPVKVKLAQKKNDFTGGVDNKVREYLPITETKTSEPNRNKTNPIHVNDPDIPF